MEEEERDTPLLNNDDDDSIFMEKSLDFDDVLKPITVPVENTQVFYIILIIIV